MTRLPIVMSHRGKRWVFDDLLLGERDTGLPLDDAPVDHAEIYYRKAAGPLEG